MSIKSMLTINKIDNCAFVGEKATKYALLTAQTDSIRIKLVDEICPLVSSNQFLLKRTTMRDVYIPNLFLNAYGINVGRFEKFFLSKVQISDDEIVLKMPKTLNKKEIPTNPLFGVVEKWKPRCINTPIIENNCKMDGQNLPKIKSFYDSESFADQCQVQLSFRGKIFCTIKQRNQYSTGVDFEILKLIYGTQLNYYPYDIVKYYVTKHGQNGNKLNIRIPKLWHLLTKRENPAIKGFVTEYHKTGFLVKPVMDNDVLTRKKLNPLQDAGEAIEICNDAVNNLDGLQDLTEAFLAFKEVEEELYAALKEKDKKIKEQEEKQKKMNKMFSSIRELLNSMPVS